MKGNNRRKKRILGIAAVLAGVILLCAGGFVYVTKYRISDIDTAVSPDGAYKLLYQSVGEPDFPFGYAHVRLVLRQEKKTVVIRSFDVANDGAVPSAEQWTVDWKDSCSEVRISGDEQPDHLYTLFYNGNTEWKVLETESGE